MKKIIVVIILVAAVAGGGWYWKRTHGGDDEAVKSADAKPGEAKAEGKGGDEKAAEGSRISHDEEGHVLIKMDDETQGNIGLLVEKPASGQLSPELKGYGKVIDPAQFATLMTDLAAAQATLTASSRELDRVKTLMGQGNASERTLQTAEATVAKDKVGVQVVEDHIMLAWGREIAERKDLSDFTQGLTHRRSVLVRIDLPAGETISGSPAGARIFKLSGASTDAEYLGSALSMDAQTLGQGYLFIIKTNSLNLVPGEAVIGYLKVPGDPLTGVNIPSNAIVRTEGAGWVYLLNTGGDQFTRTRVALDHPIETGWFITSGVTTNDYVVVSGAQILLSEELKASLKPD